MCKSSESCQFASIGCPESRWAYYGVFQEVQSNSKSCTNPMSLVWDEGDKMSNCDGFQKINMQTS